MEEVMSVMFPEDTTMRPLPQITLRKGMEKEYKFSTNQEEGQKRIKEYIDCTFAYYEAKKEREETPSIVNIKRWRKVKIREEKNLIKIKQFQSSDAIMIFTNAVRNRERRRIIGSHKEILKENIEEEITGFFGALFKGYHRNIGETFPILTSF